MNRDADELLRSYAKPLTLGLGLLAVASFVVSAAMGTPDTLPGIALGSAVLLHLERALAITAGMAVLSMFLLRAWRGDFPREFSTSGPKWSESRASEAIAIGLAQQFAASDRRALAAVERIAEQQGARDAATSNAISSWSDLIERNADRTWLAEAITRLPERQKLAIALRYFERLPEPEIARVLGVSEHTVRRITQDAVAQIRESLGSDVVEQLRRSVEPEH